MGVWRSRFPPNPITNQHVLVDEELPRAAFELLKKSSLKIKISRRRVKEAVVLEELVIHRNQNADKQ